jgi:conjugative transfer region protein (TIGR03748 family)
MPDDLTLLERARTLALALPMALIGCASEPTTDASSAMVDAPVDPPTISAVRSGRYTFVEIVPDQAQRDLMHQVIEVEAPHGLQTSVADMLRYVLLRSGYGVCESEPLARFEALPLPAAHLHLGPLILRDALEILAGPAWELTVDETTRQVCFAQIDRSLATASQVTP